MDLAQVLVLVLTFPVVSLLLVVLTVLERRLFGEPGQGRRDQAAADGHVQPPFTASSLVTDVHVPDLAWADSNRRSRRPAGSARPRNAGCPR
jgi:hypothetical protein